MATYEDILKKLYAHLQPMAAEGTTVDEDTDLVGDLGLDSLKVMDLLLEVEDEFDISIPLNALADVRTARDLAQEIHAFMERQ